MIPIGWISYSGLRRYWLPTFVILISLVIGYTEETRPKELEGVDIVENLGAAIPLDASFTDENGKPVSLGSVFAREKPVIVNLAYYQCPMLCNLVLNGLVDGVREMGWIPGQEFEILTLSIDPTEKPELAAAKKKTYMKTLGKSGAENGWHFWTGEEKEIKSVSNTIGFNYRLDSLTGEYAHGAGIFILSPQGKVSRYLYGSQFKALDLKIALLEAAEGKNVSMGDKILMFCYRYDSERGSYVLFAKQTMRTGGFVAMSAILIFLGSLWFRDIKKSRRAA